MGQRAAMQGQRIHAVGQYQPQEVAALRMRHARAGREVGCHGRQHGRLLARQRRTQLAQVAVVAALPQIGGQRQL